VFPWFSRRTEELRKAPEGGFTLVELMAVAMMVGMAVLGVALAVLGEPHGYANLLLRYGLMGAFMSALMVAWMRYRGHSWRDGGEMTAAMLLPMFALVVPVELGVTVPGLFAGSLERMMAGLGRVPGKPDLPVLEGALGPLTFVHLRREDIAAQAVSWCRAEQTGYWQQGDVVAREPHQDIARMRLLMETIREQHRPQGGA
jgi:Stf0 sulphotransferase